MPHMGRVRDDIRNLIHRSDTEEDAVDELCVYVTTLVGDENALENIWDICTTINAKLDILLRLQRSELVTQQKEVRMLENLRAAVARNRSEDASAKALIVGIAQQLRELAQRPTVDPAELQQLADDLNSSSDDLAAAVTENTPSAGGGQGGGETPPDQPA